MPATKPSLFFVFLVETGFCHIGQAGFKPLTSGDPPALASQSAGITGMNHCARPFAKDLQERYTLEVSVRWSCLFVVCFIS